MRPLAATTRPIKKMFLVFMQHSLAAMTPACPSSNSYCSCARLIACTGLLRAQRGSEDQKAALARGGSPTNSP